MDLLAGHKDLATVEVTPQHLTFAGPECYDVLGSRAQMNPPIRDAAQRDALWRAPAAGTGAGPGSDHAPHTSREKEKRADERRVGRERARTCRTRRRHET